MYSFSKRSLDNLHGIRHELRKVVERAIQFTAQDFTVVEGLRKAERQAELVASGASKTFASKHIEGKAVDLYPFFKSAKYPKGSVHVSAEDAGESDEAFFMRFVAIRNAMFQAAGEIGVNLRWGGDWDMDGKSNDERFLDLVHFEMI